jgi:geranylgeranylglycerol-phosphate geranylgeranyltransferase
MIKAIWELLRLEHGFMYALGVVVGIVVSAGLDFSLECLILGMLTAIFCQASAFALNDYIDYEVDLANRRFDRPLVRGELSRRSALVLAILLAPLGFISAYLISFNAFLLAFAITLLGYAYNIKLKEFGLIGNIYIAFSMSAPFIFGSFVVADTLTPQAGLLATIAFLSGVAREIMKGIEDVEGDALRNARTIARIKGVEFAARLSSALFVFAVLLSPIPFLVLEEYKFDLKYLIPVAITDVMLVKVSLDLLKRHEKESIKRYRKLTLLALLFGLIGFLLGAV